MSWLQLEDDEHDEEKTTRMSRGRRSRKSIFVITYGNNNIQMLHLISALVQLIVALNLVQAVQVQRLNVPDLVVIDSHVITASATANQQPQQQRPAHSIADLRLQTNPGQPPEAASLIQSPPVAQPQQQITFECLVSYDEKRDRNLVVKWHHDERMEPIYQWIPELNKRSIAPQYRAYIVPIIATTTTTTTTGDNHSSSSWSTNQTLSAGFRLVRPTKELAGKYTCSAISSQNDDSKSKKMIVYTPPRSFSFNATRANLAALFASQRDRLLQLSHPQPQAQPQLPPAYRMRTYDNQAAPSATTLSPQMLSTIDYVNVNQQRARHQAATRQTFYWPNATTASANTLQQQQQQPPPKRPQFGLKLVCDIDQVFPVPEVSIYRLAKLDGSHPEKLAKLDTRIERDSNSGLFHVQVISVLDDEDLLARYYQHRPNSTEQLPLEIYFECLIALTNLELSRYAENRRTIIYRPGALASSSRQQGLQTNHENMDLEQVGSGAQALQPCALVGPFLLTVTLLMLHKWQSHG